MADLFQGEALPATVSTIQTQKTAPEFYTNYLQDIANLGMAGVQQSGVAGLSPLQQQAMAMAPQAAFSGMGTMGAGAQMAGAAGSTAAPSIINQYMNPYTTNVVDEMARLQQQNIKESAMPAMKGAAGAMGQFGSSRQFNATGNMLRDMQSNLLGQQAGALQSGYTGAMTAAQNDLNRQLQSGQSLGSIGTQQQAAATSGLGTLSTLGKAEQEQGQKMLDLPMQQAQAYAKLMQGYSIPTGETQQTTASSGMSNSPLSQISGLLTALAAYNPQTTIKQTPTVSLAPGERLPSGKTGGYVSSYAGGGDVSLNAPNGAAYHDGQGNFYDQDGYLIG
jgi:hypothetical protein